MDARTLAEALGVKSRDAVQDQDSENGDGEGGICVVCSDEASGKHYGVMTCNGCKGFFRRSVRAPKPYECRGNNDCQVDKQGRNGCRACRFKRCLEVGMDAGAIRPDRDKTGKRGSSAISSTSFNLINDTSSPMKRMKEEEHSHVTVSAETVIRMAAKPPMTSDLDAQSVLHTLRQCDDAVSSLYDCPPPTFLFPDAFSLADAAAHPTVISPRTPFSIGVDGGIANCKELVLNVRRLLCQLLDFINTLRPVADFSMEEKTDIARQAAPSFVLFGICVHTLMTGAPSHSLILPLGQTISRDLPLFDSSDEDSKLRVQLEMRVNTLKTEVIDHLMSNIRELNLSEEDISSIRSLIILQSSLPSDRISSTLLKAAKDSILDALHSSISSRITKNEANARFGSILLLLSALQRYSMAAVMILQFSSDNDMGVDAAIQKFLFSF